MIDTGASITLVSKTWAEAHGLKITEVQGVRIRGAAGQAIEVIGTTSFTAQLSPSLEIDVTDVAVSNGTFYQCLMGCDMLRGKSGILGPATITMSDGKKGNIQWR